MSSFPFDRYQAEENFSASLVHMEVLHSVTIGYAHQVELRENGYGLVPVREWRMHHQLIARVASARYREVLSNDRKLDGCGNCG